MIEAIEYATPSQIRAREQRRQIRNRIAARAVTDRPIDLKKRFKAVPVASGPCGSFATYFHPQHTIEQILEHAPWWCISWEHIDEPKRPLNIEHLCDMIEQAVCREFLVDAADIIGKTREHRFVRPRHLLMYLIRSRVHLSYPAIGKRFDCRHHTSVIHACENTVKCMNEMPNFSLQCKRVIACVDAMLAAE